MSELVPNTSSSPIDSVRVLIVQDHPLLASAIAQVLDAQADMTVCGIARRADEAVRLAATMQRLAPSDVKDGSRSGPCA